MHYGSDSEPQTKLMLGKSKSFESYIQIEQQRNDNARNSHRFYLVEKQLEPSFFLNLAFQSLKIRNFHFPGVQFVGYFLQNMLLRQSWEEF